MSAIGLRVTTSEIFYVIIGGCSDEPTLLENEKIRKPKAFELPATLAWYRNNLIELLTEHKIRTCGIKTAEPFSRSMGASAKEGAVIRANIEGVLMEVAHTTGKKVVAGPYATISSLLESKKAKSYLGKDDFRGIEGWDKLNDNFKEAALAGVAALSLLES